MDRGSVGAELPLFPPEPLEEIPVGVGGGLGLVHNHIVHGQAVQGGKPWRIGGQIVFLILKAPLHVTVTRPETWNAANDDQYSLCYLDLLTIVPVSSECGVVAGAEGHHLVIVSLLLLVQRV